MTLLRGRRALVMVAPGIVERQLQWLLAQWGVTARILTDDVIAADATQPFDVVIVDADADQQRRVDRARAVCAGTGAGLVVVRRLRASGVADEVNQVVKPIRARALYDALRSALALVDSSRAAATPSSPAPGPTLSILLVEDDPANRRIARLMLDELGYHAEEAVNGIEALERARSRAYDVILMDLQMPGLDGLETTRRIRADRPGRSPFIIALTASVMQDDQSRCRAAGMDGYLVKPLRLDTLADALAKVAAS
jgi:CheY-like chemotaxis protein